MQRYRRSNVSFLFLPLWSRVDFIIYLANKRHLSCLIHAPLYCKPHHDLARVRHPPDALQPFFPTIFVFSLLSQCSLTFSSSDQMPAGLDYPAWLRRADGSTKTFPLGSCLSLKGNPLTLVEWQRATGESRGRVRQTACSGNKAYFSPDTSYSPGDTQHKAPDMTSKTERPWCTAVQSDVHL